MLLFLTYILCMVLSNSKLIALNCINLPSGHLYISLLYFLFIIIQQYWRCIILLLPDLYAYIIHTFINLHVSLCRILKTFQKMQAHLREDRSLKYILSMYQFISSIINFNLQLLVPLFFIHFTQSQHCKYCLLIMKNTTHLSNSSIFH